uniref:Uncharacterized protein n=1 Tax=Romanomermis culicivorax TaxID=13658 RepID=A0A915I138_ROMCU
MKNKFIDILLGSRTICPQEKSFKIALLNEKDLSNMVGFITSVLELYKILIVCIFLTILT